MSINTLLFYLSVTPFISLTIFELMLRPNDLGHVSLFSVCLVLFFVLLFLVLALIRTYRTERPSAIHYSAFASTLIIILVQAIISLNLWLAVSRWILVGLLLVYAAVLLVRIARKKKQGEETSRVINPLTTMFSYHTVVLFLTTSLSTFMPYLS